MSSKKKTLGERIQFIRESEGMTRKEFSECTGIPVNTLVGYEKRGKDPAGMNLEKIAGRFPDWTAYLLRGAK